MHWNEVSWCVVASAGVRREDAWVSAHVLGKEDPGMDCISWRSPLYCYISEWPLSLDGCDPNGYVGEKPDALIALAQGSPHLFLEGRCPAEFSSNPNQTHLKQLIKVFLGILETSRQVCWGKLELNSAGHRPSRTECGDPCSSTLNTFLQ